MNKIKRALISVWNKEGVVELANFLVQNDIEIISTGGTKKELERNDIKVSSVSDLTMQKEIMDGRVKTLHPKIFGGVLADRNNENHLRDLEEQSSGLIDLVIINLYPFMQEAVDKKLDLKKAIEYIDIGGPSLLRASAKNFQHVVVLSSPNQYKIFVNEFIAQKGSICLEDKIKYAKAVFDLTYKYDQMIFKYFNSYESTPKDEILFKNNKYIIEDNLRYGENPHQKAIFYKSDNEKNIFKQIHGKKLSYNNYFDIESAAKIVFEFNDNACSIIKHSNPCGFGIGDNNLESYTKAVSTDPVSYFGGIVAFNNEVNSSVAEVMSKSFLECIVAPSFTDKAISILSNKKNLRLIIISKNDIMNKEDDFNIKSVFNGFLYQTNDSFIKDSNDFEIVSKRKPNNIEFSALELGWKLVKFVKSNAIVFNTHDKLLGVGAGQMSRIDSVKNAIRKSKENGLNLDQSFMASDAFFPFSDSIELAASEGVLGVIQPGGSVKDKEVIKVVDDLNLIMVLTKERHFYH